MNEFTIVPAGAGAGKTHRIGKELVSLVRQKKVDPARILAVTFTEAAASELRQRIRTLLLEKGMLEEAIAVERAYVSTIHSLGLRILTEHAFANGSSPIPRLLTDDERDVLIRRILFQTSDLATISADVSRFGFSANGYDGRSPEDKYREAVARTVSLLSTLRDPEPDEDLSAFSVQEIIRIYGPVDDDPKHLADRLHGAVTDLLSAFPDGVPPAGLNDTARRAFGDNLRDLRKASNREQLDWDWTLWNRLRKLRKSVRGTPTPPGYDDLADAVIAASNEITSHPGPRDDACVIARSLIRGATSILGSYNEQKASLGVIDFGDMVRDAERLLRQSESVRNAVMDEIDCVIVDEFQDTNPIQFALLWQLAAAAPHALFVGDIKQAIMEFQGADPRLTQELIGHFPESVVPLTSNWRSDPRIMDFINALGANLFPGEYHQLSAERTKGSAPAITMLSMEGSRSTRSPDAWKPEQHVASYLREVLDDASAFVRDKRGSAPRRALAGDVAILCRTHRQCATYASALRQVGLPVRVNGGDWWNSPVVLSARYALTLAADPADRHAALALATMGPLGLPLEVALRELIAGTLLDRSELDRVRNLSAVAGSATVSALLSDVIQHSGLRDWVEVQPDPLQSRADLLRLEAEALEFQTLHRDVKAASGFFGSGAQIFLGWLHSKVSDERLNSQPDPNGNASDGIEVVTWHASKGREWPVVIVATLDGDYAPQPGSIQSEFTSFVDLDKVLETARLRYTPAFATPEAWERFEGTLLPAAERTARRLLYVAMTRARDSLVLEWPTFKFAKKSKEGAEPPLSYAHLLAKECSLDLRAGGIAVGDLEFPTRVIACPKTGWVGAAEKASGNARTGRVQMIGRPAILRRAMMEAGPAWSIQPSGVSAPPASATSLVLESVRICQPIEVPTGLSGTAAEQGTSLHDAFRAILLRPDLADRIGQRSGLENTAVKHLIAQAGALRTFLSSRGWIQLSLELPIAVSMPDGSTVSGIIDCLGYGNSSMVVIDHKTNKGDDLSAGFLSYQSQLELYRSAILASGHACSAISIGIHWLRHGIVTISNSEIA